MDFLFNEYQLNHFADIDLTNQDLSNPEMLKLINYIESIQKKEIQFDDVPMRYRLMLADLIYRV